MTSETYTTRGGKTRYRPVLTGTETSHIQYNTGTGFCIACGSQLPVCHVYECASCGECKVYGIEELLMMGLVRLPVSLHSEAECDEMAAEARATDEARAAERERAANAAAAAWADEILRRVHSALGEIDCAISQSIPLDDDRIIAEHIHSASRVLHGLADQLNADRRANRSQP